MTAYPVTISLLPPSSGRRELSSKAPSRAMPRDLHRPVLGDPDLDPAPHRERVEGRLLRLDRRLAEVDLAAGHDRGRAAAAEVLGAGATLDAAHEAGDVEVAARFDSRRRRERSRGACGAPDHGGAPDDQEQGEDLSALEDLEVDEEETASQEDEDQPARARGRVPAVGELREPQGDQEDRPQADELACLEQAEVVQREQQPQQQDARPEDEPEQDVGVRPIRPHVRSFPMDDTGPSMRSRGSIRRTGGNDRRMTAPFRPGNP